MKFFRTASAIALLSAALFIAPPSDRLEALGNSVGDTTVADFDLGATADSASSATGDGAVALSPGSSNFNSAPDDWAWNPFGSSSTHGSINGELNIDGGQIQSPNALMHGKSFAFEATFSRVPNQQVGITVPGNPNLSVALSTGDSPDGYLWLKTYGAPATKSKWAYTSAPVKFKIESSLLNISISQWTGSVWGPPLVSLNVTQKHVVVFASDGVADGVPLRLGASSAHSYLETTENCDGPSGWKAQGSVNYPPVVWNDGICSVGVGYSAWYKSPLSVTRNTQVDFWGTLGLRANGTFSLESGTNPFGFFNGNANALTVLDARTSSSSYGLQGMYASLPKSLAGVEHHYRIKVLSDRVEFSVPDVPTIPLMTSLGSTATDYYSVWARNVDLNKAVITPLPGSADHKGRFTSRVLDTGRYGSWDSLDWNGTIPADTTATFELRTGNTASPDSTWSGFTPVDKSQASLGQKGRYGQYRIKFTSIVDRTVPEVTDVTFQTSAIPPSGTLVDSTVADFDGGQHSNTVSAPDAEDGSVALLPNYSLPGGSALPVGWDFFGPGQTTSNGALYLDGSSGKQISTPRTAATSITFDATMQGSRNQQVGLKSESPDDHYEQVVWFDYDIVDGNLLARSVYQTHHNDGWSPYTTNLGSLGPGGPGRQTYRIDITSSGQAYFFVNGVHRATLPVGPLPMYAWLHDSEQDGAPLVVDGVGVSEALSGTFTSRVLGAPGSAIAGSVDWNATIPSGSTLGVWARAGNTTTPDSSWTGWKSVINGAELPVSGAYLQYKVEMLAGPGALRPSWQGITFQSFPS